MFRGFINYLRFRINQRISYRKMNSMRRSIEEIFEMKVFIEQQYLSQDRQEKDTSVSKARLDLINWILGEKV